MYLSCGLAHKLFGWLVPNSGDGKNPPDFGVADVRKLLAAPLHQVVLKVPDARTEDVHGGHALAELLI